MKQKFKTGEIVRIADRLPAYMSHFDKGVNAVIVASYAQQYGGHDHAEYTVLLLDAKGKPYNEVAWYEVGQLTSLGLGRKIGKRLIHKYTRRR